MIVHLRSLDDLDIHLRKERPSGVVRLSPGDDQRFSAAFAEAQKVAATFPRIAVILVKGLDSEEDEEAAARMIEEHGVRDRLLSLPTWWRVTDGRVTGVFKQSEKLVREVLGLFSRKKPEAGADLAPLLDWVGKQVGSGARAADGGRATKPSREADRPTRPSARKREADRPTRPSSSKRRAAADDKTPPRGVAVDPWGILGVPKGSSLEVAQKSYRELCARYHPDKVAHLGEREQAHANRRMAEINAAWQAIKRQLR